MAESWIVKYVPRKSSEVVGQEGAVEQLKAFIEGKSKKKAMIAYGPYGCGKTSAVYTLANESGFEVVEMNASDFRNKDRINSVIGNAMGQMSLFHEGKVILVDEIDGLSGTKDRGGIQAVTALVKDSVFPVILTANDPYNSKFSGLRRVSSMVEFKPLDYMTIFEVLRRICGDEKVKYDEMCLKSLARRAGGDLRAAINDLQSVAGASRRVGKDTLELLSHRKQTEDMRNALVRVFKTTDEMVAKQAFSEVNENIDEQFLWLEENIPKEYTEPEDLARAYDVLSRADVFKGRIRRQQHWRFLAYISELMTAGIALSKREKYKSMPNYSRTTKLLEIWKANMKYMKRKSIAQKIAEKTHSSSKEVVQDTLPYIQYIFQNNPEMGEAITEDFELDDEEVEWLEK